MGCSDAHNRILSLAARCFAAERRSIDEHGDACDALWAELRDQTQAVGETIGPLKSAAQIERECERKVLSRLRKALPDLVKEALS